MEWMQIVKAAERVEEVRPSNWKECCVWVRLVLCEIYGRPLVDRAPVQQWHLHSVADPWGPCTAAENAIGASRAAHARRVSEVVLPEGTYIAQHWAPKVPAAGESLRGVHGHTLLLTVDRTGRRSGWRVWDSTAATGPRLPRLYLPSPDAIMTASLLPIVT